MPQVEIPRPTANTGRRRPPAGYVIKAGPAYELVATNQLDAPMLATPAISDGRLFIRTKDEIMAFGQ